MTGTEAIRVAAFSLYLAMLHYLEPPDILQNRLPSLTYGPVIGKKDPEKYFDILLAEDVTGKGHISRGVGSEDRISLFIPLADR